MKTKKRHYNIPIFLPHAACPFRCVFCDQYLITSQIQVPLPEEVTAMIEETLSTIPENADIEAAFFGGNFTALPTEKQELYLQSVQPWLKSGRIQGIRLSTRPDCIDEENLRMLKKYGVEVVELGIQSFAGDVLRASGRGYTPEQAEKACREIKKAGLKLGIQLMPGLPKDTMEKSVFSAEKAVELQADMARIYPTVVLKGTPLAFMMEQGRYQPLSIEKAIEVSKEMLWRLEYAQIPVIRLGLYIGEDLQNAENVCGGAFHPALGELVEQRIFREQTQMLLEKYSFPQESVIFYVNRRDLSKFMGWHRENWINFEQIYAKIRVKGVESPEQNWVGAGRDTSTEPEIILTRAQYLEQRVKQAEILNPSNIFNKMK